MLNVLQGAREDWSAVYEQALRDLFAAEDDLTAAYARLATAADPLETLCAGQDVLGAEAAGMHATERLRNALWNLHRHGEYRFDPTDDAVSAAD